METSKPRLVTMFDEFGNDGYGGISDIRIMDTTGDAATTDLIDRCIQDFRCKWNAKPDALFVSTSIANALFKITGMYPAEDNKTTTLYMGIPIRIDDDIKGNMVHATREASFGFNAGLGLLHTQTVPIQEISKPYSGDFIEVVKS